MGIHREPLELDSFSPAEQTAISQALRQFDPAMADELARHGLVHLAQAPFLQAHRILEVDGVAPLRRLVVALGSDGTARLLSGALDTWNHMMEAEEAPSFDDELDCRVYVNLCDLWTSERSSYELLVESFTDIPWLEDLHPAEEALVEGLRDALGQVISPLHFERTEDGFLVVKWILVQQEILCRVLEVSLAGRVTRLDDVYDTDLPVPTGEVWAVAKGRVVPTG